MVEEEYARLDKDGVLRLPDEEIARITAYFAPPPYKSLSAFSPELEEKKRKDKAFADWVSTNVAPHKVPGYAIANISLKAKGETPGDCSSDEMDAIADLADKLSFSEVRVSHEQNLVLPYVEQRELYGLWKALLPLNLATPNLGLASDIICCPGLDYCNLANARSIPIAQALSNKLNDLALERNIGPLRIKISGCINACGHHHVGHIGILGVEKKGTEFYQISLGGSADENASLGDIVGPSFAEEEVTGAVGTILDTYLALRAPAETFLQTYRRVGLEPFKEKLYAAH
jgi:sulfite reductase (NADPH) hemoprotein beta-component